MYEAVMAILALIEHPIECNQKVTLADTTEELSLVNSKNHEK